MKHNSVSTIPSAPAGTAFLYAKAKTVAKQAGVSSKTIHRWAQAKFISRRVINSRVVLFSIPEVQAFIESANVS
jgi:hypothetical protein